MSAGDPYREHTPPPCSDACEKRRKLFEEQHDIDEKFLVAQQQRVEALERAITNHCHSFRGLERSLGRQVTSVLGYFVGVTLFVCVFVAGLRIGGWR